MSVPVVGEELEPGQRGRLAYLVNQYPAPSHSFIRREIAAMEALGWQVHRYSHRRYGGGLVDPADIEESVRTHVLVEQPPLSCVWIVLRWLLTRPIHTTAALVLAIRMAWRGDHRIVAHLGYFGLACILSRSLAQTGCQHLHVHFGTNPAAVALLAHRLCGVSYSFTAHGPHEFDPELRLNLQTKNRDALFVAVVSKTAHAQLLERFPNFSSKVRQVPCGLDARWFAGPSPARRHGSIEFLCVARLDEQKDPMLLLAAVQLLRGRGRSFRVKMAGDGTLRGRVATCVSDEGLSHYVEVLGWQTQQQVAEHLRGARALVLSSKGEGLPVAIMEAFAIGVPAIAPDVGGVSELVESGATGWLVKPGDPAALAKAMWDCLGTGEQELSRFGTEAARRVRDHDIRRSARLLTEAIGSLPA